MAENLALNACSTRTDASIAASTSVLPATANPSTENASPLIVVSLLSSVSRLATTRAGRSTVLSSSPVASDSTEKYTAVCSCLKISSHALLNFV